MNRNFTLKASRKRKLGTAKILGYSFVSRFWLIFYKCTITFLFSVMHVYKHKLTSGCGYTLVGATTQEGVSIG